MTTKLLQIMGFEGIPDFFGKYYPLLSGVFSFSLTFGAVTGAIYFRTGGANTRMTIDKDGNIGVGTSPTEKLDVNGNVLVQGLLKLKPQTS